MILAVALAFFIPLTLLIVIRRLHAYRLRTKLNIPGPKTNLLFGNVLTFIDPSLKWEENPSRVFAKWQKEYGDVYGIYIGPKLTVVITNLNMATEVLIKKFSCFADRSHLNILEKKPMCDCLINLRGEKWKNVRCAVVKTFSNRIMRKMSEAMETKITEFMNVVDSHAASGQPFDIYKCFQALTLDVIALCEFAIDIDSLHNAQHPFLVECRNLFDGYNFNNSWIIKFSLLFPELDFLLTQFVPFTKFRKAELSLIQHLKKVLEQKKTAGKVENSADLIYLLMNNNNNLQPKSDDGSAGDDKETGVEMSDDLIVASALMFLIAGYETSSSALGFAAWLLAKHQHVQHRLQMEIDEKIDEQDLPKYEAFSDMPFMDAVLSETLRMFPPVVSLVVRTCIETCIVNHIEFQPGMQVLFPMYNLHHDPALWPEPEKFDPDRFIKKDFLPTSWMPFGIGPRNCIGKRFAQMEVRLVMSRLLRKYTLKLQNDSENSPKTFFNGAMMRPLDGVFVYAVKR